LLSFKLLFAAINQSSGPAMKLNLWGWSCLFLLPFFATNIRANDFDQLLAKVPGSANAIVLIDVEKTLASELAQKEGWVRN
jgi:hypothetical protein